MRFVFKVISIIFIYIIVSCNGSDAVIITNDSDSISNYYANKSNVPSYENQKFVFIDTSYKVDVAKLTDSTVLNNEFYKVIIIPKEGECGNLIGIYNKQRKKSFSINEGAAYYVAVIDSYIIIDSGTGVTRGLSIYNLNSVKKVFEAVYEENLEVNQKRIKFKTQVQISDSAKRPKCPDFPKDLLNSLGYVECQIFNLDDLSLEKTGKYECYYIE